jgi:glycosyltransferase involved in cell wall biosynthesis
VLFHFKKNDVLILFPAFDFRLLILLLAKIKQIIVILEINEYPLVHLKKSKVVKIKQLVVVNSFRLYDGFIVISEELRKLINKYKPDDSKIVKIPIITFDPPKNKSKLSPLNCPYLFHAGSLYENKDYISGMIESFGIAKKELKTNLKYVFTGDIKKCSNHKNIEDIIYRFDLKDEVVFTGYLSTEELDAYFSFASLALIYKKDNIQNKYCFATKLAEYLSYKIPVISSCVGESNNYLIDNENSYLVYKDDPYEFSKKIVDVFKNRDKATTIATNGFNLYKDKFHCESQKDILVKFIKSF